MPQGETFWNPYRFIPIRDEITRRAPATHERFIGKSGTIHCTLENLTLLFLGNQNQFPKSKGRAVIPGSSLKGVLRSLAETVGGGCFVTNPKGQGDHYRSLPDKYKACDNAQKLCITCRLFGMMERGAGARMHMGQVGISDALLPEGQHPQVQPVEILLMGPKPRHASFYLTPATAMPDYRARKFYFHQPRGIENVTPIPQGVRRAMAGDIKTISALRSGHVFSFAVDFYNLSEEELQLLVYVLALEERVEVDVGPERTHLHGPLRHKIGLGKPLGLGTCRIAIHQITYHPDPAIMFASLVPAAGRILEGEPLSQAIVDLTERYVADHSPTMEHLRKMLVWDENDPRSFHYPERTWFQSPGNGGKPLKAL